MATVLISDKLAPEGIAILEAAEGLTVINRPGLDPEALKAALKGVDGIVIRSGTTLTADILEAAEGLRVVGRAGIGVDNVDVDAASKLGIVVMNTPGGNTVTTAEHTVSMLLASARNIPQANQSLRAGEWKRNEFVGTEVFQKTLGIVGIGNIGSIVADRCRGLHMSVIAYDPFITEEAAARLGIELVSLADLYARADFISVHTPLTAETRGLIGAEAFAAMKKGVRIVNCARGGIVDEDALLAGLESGHVASAALDVFTEEPPPADSPLIAHPRLVATPHLGAATGEAQLNVALDVAAQVRDFLLNDEIRNAVNVPSVSQETAGRLGPYLILAEKLGSLQSQTTERVPSEVRIEYRGEVAELDCRSVTAAVLKGLLANCMESPVNTVNAPFLAKDRGIQVVEVKSPGAGNFTHSVCITFTTPNGTNVIEGTVFSDRVVRIVRYGEFYLEVEPAGNILVLHNRDVPGVIGRVGTFLGGLGVNIAGFVLGRVGAGDEAVSFVHIDSPLNTEQVESLRALADITAVQMVTL